MPAAFAFLIPEASAVRPGQSARFEIGRLEFDEADAPLDGFDREIDEPVDPAAVMAEKLGDVGKLRDRCRRRGRQIWQRCVRPVQSMKERPSLAFPGKDTVTALSCVSE